MWTRVVSIRVRTLSTPPTFETSKEDGRDEFILSKKVKRAVNTKSFEGAIVYGKQRVGKTSYGLQVLYDVYGDWEKVLEHVFFRLEDLVEFLRESHRKRQDIDAILWDDCGVYGSSGLWFSDRQMAEYLQNLIDVVGIRLGGLLMTTPNPENLLKCLRSYEFYRVKCIRHNQRDRRLAKGYKSILYPSGKLITPQDFRDYYNVMLPDDVYKVYEKTRESYLNEAMDNLDEYLVEKGVKG